MSQATSPASNGVAMNGAACDAAWERKIRARRTATAALLQRLIVDRATVEARLAERAKPDPMKACTGHSAFDRAIAETQACLIELDEVVDRLDADAIPTITITACNPATRASIAV